MIYRWVFNQLKNQPDRIKDELYTFLGDTPDLKAIENYLPAQKGKSFELRDYQQEAIDSLKSMRERGITPNGLSYISGVSQSTIKSILNGESQNPGIATIKKICDGLNITIGEFFNTEEFNRLEQELE